MKNMLRGRVGKLPTDAPTRQISAQSPGRGGKANFFWPWWWCCFCHFWQRWSFVVEACRSPEQPQNTSAHVSSVFINVAWKVEHVFFSNKKIVFLNWDVPPSATPELAWFDIDCRTLSYMPKKGTKTAPMGSFSGWLWADTMSLLCITPIVFVRFETPCSSSVRSLSSVACWGRQKDKAPEQNRNKISVLDALALFLSGDHRGQRA